MNALERIKQLFRKRSVWIALYVLMFLLVLGTYAVEVFVWRTPPLKSLPRVLLILLLLAISLFRIIIRHRKNIAAAEQIYADHIENAFQKDKTKKRKLLSALVDYNLGYLSECVKKLTALSKESETIEERRVAKYFTALCYKGCGKPDAAAELYHQILKESPDYSPALSNLSVVYFEKQNYRKAIEFAEKAINCNSGNPFAYNNLAGAYLEIYDFEKAKKYALRALDLKKDLYQAQTTLSIAFAAEGDALAAKRYAELAVSLGEDANALAAATQNYKKDYARHQVIQARLADWKQKTGIPAIHFTLDGQFEKSIIGGRINEPAPISASGKSMRLLAAIFCSELPENNIFPQHGVLRFYISPDAYYGASLEHYEEMNIQKEFRVLFDEDERAFSTSAYYGSEDELFPVFGSYHPRFTLEQEGMPVFDFRYEDTKERVLENSDDKAAAAADYQDEDFQEGINPNGHKLGGYPCFTQEDPRGNYSDYSKYDALLFQLDSDDTEKKTKVMFGDGGVCNFFIPSEKLKKHDFSDILYTWDCF